ncbi:MAG: penicillin-binding protein 2 [Candidatus Saccharibacteria bacterium]|nr:penicillin-binding protein 2 [Candidatus Saccharibacteria bacterium]
MKRVKFLRLCLVLAVAVILTKLFQIQILEHDFYVAKAEAEHTSLYDIVAKRGEIYMLDGEEPVPVVLNTTVFSVIVDPQTVSREAVSELLSKIEKSRWAVSSVDEIFEDESRRYLVIAKNIPRADYLKIAEEVPGGAYVKSSNQRVYAEGDLAASTLGFVNADGVGQYGVEGALNKELAGKNGMLKTITDVNKVALSIGDDNIRIPAEDGKNIVLTVDRNIQKKVEDVLSQHMKDLGISHGSAMVYDPNSGKVMAMVSFPSYSPANYGAVEDASVYVNDVLETPYEPGSICKGFTMASAINEGKMTPETTYYNEGTTMVDGWPIDNAQKEKQLGEITMRTALQWSLNTGSVQALRLLGGSTTEITQRGKELLYDYYYNHYGLGQPTGIELYENTGTVVPPDSEYAYNSTYANMTFGQGLNVTMVQVASGWSSLINGGYYYQPTVIAGYIDKNGNFKKAEKKEPVRTTVTPETSATMRGMLHDTRWWMGDPEEYYFGGKTGTAQAIRDGAYVMDEFVSGYIGFGGASQDHPEYVIIVKMWEKGRTTSSEEEVRPVFEDLKMWMIDYLRIKPNKGGAE